MSDDLEIVYLCALRYSFYRNTYVPGIIIEEFSKVVSKMSQKNLCVACKDILDMFLNHDSKPNLIYKDGIFRIDFDMNDNTIDVSKIISSSIIYQQEYNALAIKIQKHLTDESKEWLKKNISTK